MTRTSIRQQLTRRLLLAFALPLMVSEAGVFVLIRADLLRQFDAALRAKAMAIAAVTRQRDARVEVDRGDRFLREFDDVRRPSSFFQMRGADGTTVSRSASLQGSDLPVPAGTPSLEHPAYWNIGRAPDPVRATGVVFVPRMSRDERAAHGPRALVLVVAASRAELDRTLQWVAATLAGCGILVLSATAFVVPRVLRRGLGPVAALGRQAAHINADSLAARFPSGEMPPELAPIAGALNDLLARLEQSFERERQFSADLAHELRTPIAELRSLAELALRWPAARDPRTDRDALEIAVHMEGIVTRLLELHRAERGQVSVEREPVPVAAALRRVWHIFADRADERGLRVNWSASNDQAVMTNPVIFRSLLVNLFANAVEYTPAGGAIQVEVAGPLPGLEIRIANDAADLTTEHLPRLFDRFWRRDPARAGSHRSGLGLSIARALAHALGCGLTASIPREGWLMFTLAGLEAAERPADAPAPDGKHLVTGDMPESFSLVPPPSQRS